VDDDQTNRTEPSPTTTTDREPTTPTKVTLTTPGISVHIESRAPLDQVADRAEQLHRDLAARHGSLPDGIGGYL
jgi:hypothetical protein